MITKSFGLVVTAGFLTSLAALAQIPNASQQVDAVQQRRQLDQSEQLLVASNSIPELYSDESSDVGPQSVLQVRQRRTLVEAFADVQYFYTDNMFLANQNKQKADVVVSTLQAALAPSPYPLVGGLFSPRVGFQEQWFSYGVGNSEQVTVYNLITRSFQTAGLDQFDFNAMTIFGDVAWRRENWTFTLGTDFRRLLDTTSSAEFYREYVPRWAVRRDLFTSDRTVLSFGYEGDYRVTETQNVPPNAGDNFNDRTDQSLVLVGSWRLCRYAFLQPSYRFQYTHFTTIRRDDFLNSFGLTLYCPVTSQISLRTYISYDDLNTDGFYVDNYEKLDVGGGLNLTLRF